MWSLAEFTRQLLNRVYKFLLFSKIITKYIFCEIVILMSSFERVFSLFATQVYTGIIFSKKIISIPAFLHVRHVNLWRSLDMSEITRRFIYEKDAGDFVRANYPRNAAVLDIIRTGSLWLSRLQDEVVYSRRLRRTLHVADVHQRWCTEPKYDQTRDFIAKRCNSFESVTLKGFTSPFWFIFLFCKTRHSCNKLLFIGLSFDFNFSKIKEINFK